MGQLIDPSAAPEVLHLCTNVIYLLLGIYGWEYLHSLHIEYAVILGRIPFRPSLVPYILGRTCLLIYLLLLTVGTTLFSGEINCPAGLFAIATLSAIAVGCASTNFLIRTWVIWKGSFLVHVLLVLFALGHWALLLVDVALTRAVSMDGICDIYYNHIRMDAITLIYTTVLDFLVLVLLVVGLSSQRFASALKKHLCTQGICYFAIAGTAYIPPMVAALLDHTPVYDLVSALAITVSTIVSSRAVRSLRSLETCDASKDSSIELTTQIQVQPTLMQEGPRV